eukprot:1293308-Lingulodinium_polyedra.AAC.1
MQSLVGFELLLPGYTPFGGATQGRPPFHPRFRPQNVGPPEHGPIRFPQVPFQHPRSRTAALAPTCRSLRRPD